MTVKELADRVNSIVCYQKSRKRKMTRKKVVYDFDKQNSITSCSALYAYTQYKSSYTSELSLHKKPSSSECEQAIDRLLGVLINSFKIYTRFIQG